MTAEDEDEVEDEEEAKEEKDGGMEVRLLKA